MKPNKLLSVFLWTLLSVGAVHAQSSPPLASPASDEGLAKACEAAAVELKLRRAEVAALEAKVAAQDAVIGLLKEQVTAALKLAETWQTAAEARKEANQLDARIEASYQRSIDEYKAETARLRSEIESLKKSRKVWGVVGAIIGVGVVAGRGN